MLTSKEEICAIFKNLMHFGFKAPHLHLKGSHWPSCYAQEIRHSLYTSNGINYNLSSPTTTTTTKTMKRKQKQNPHKKATAQIMTDRPPHKHSNVSSYSTGHQLSHYITDVQRPSPVQVVIVPQSFFKLRQTRPVRTTLQIKMKKKVFSEKNRYLYMYILPIHCHLCAATFWGLRRVYPEPCALSLRMTASPHLWGPLCVRLSSAC